MAEQLVNEFTVNRPVDEAWTVITDVERIAPCLPGAQLQEIAQTDDGDVYRGIVKVKLGSITPQFKGQAIFLERDDDAHRAVLKAEGRDSGGRGNASAEITAEAESLSPTSTKVTVTTDLHVTGKVAQFGRGVMGDVSKKLMQQFANNLNSMLDEDPTEADNDHAADTAADDDETPVTGTTVAGMTAGDGSAAPETSPRVRKIDSPASEPVDMASIAGPALLKRLGPAVAAVLVLLLLLRRRH